MFIVSGLIILIFTSKKQSVENLALCAAGHGSSVSHAPFFLDEIDFLLYLNKVDFCAGFFTVKICSGKDLHYII